MRYKTVVVLLVFFVASCDVDSKRGAISSYLETVDGITYDYNTKVSKLREMPPVTANDSLKLIYIQLDSLEKVVDFNMEAWEIVNMPKTREEIRADIVPKWIDDKIEEYQANTDSVLLIPYQAEVKQTINGTKQTFAITAFFRQNQVFFIEKMDSLAEF